MTSVYTIDLPVFSIDGEKVDTLVLRGDHFIFHGIHSDLVYDHVRYIRNNLRDPIAHTKDRGDVAGSNKKMFSQKGHGTGRVGEKRSPLRRKGGVVFGPSNQKNYSLFMNKKSRRRAMCSVLLYFLANGKVIVIDSLVYPSIAVSHTISLKKKLSLSQDQESLFVSCLYDDVICRSVRNLEKTRYCTLSSLNTYILLSADALVISKDAFLSLLSILGLPLSS